MGMGRAAGAGVASGKADDNIAFLERRRHSTAGTSCADVDLADRRVAALLCRLYEADYTCFNYARPSCGEGNL